MRDDHDQHSSSPRSRFAVVRDWLLALRDRTRHGATTAGYQARLRLLAARTHAEVVRHRVSHASRRTVLVVVAAVGLVVAGVATSVALVDGGHPDHVRRVAGPVDDTVRFGHDDRADRHRRNPSASDDPDARPDPTQPSRTPDETTPSASDNEPSPSPSPSAKPEQSEGKQATPKAEKPKAQETKTPDWVHPMPGAVTTSCYGPRWGTMHMGVDLAMPAGTPIRAVGAGTVIYAGWVFSGYGISVVIDHHNGYLTHYAHASETTVSVGQNVKPGQVIALEGSTGDSTGPHLHFEVHQGMWNQIEPTSWMRERGVTIEGC